MKRRRLLPTPQREFGFTQDTFNLFQETTLDGERIAREREEAQKARQLADAAQAPLFACKETAPVTEALKLVRRRRRIVISLEPGNMLAMRLERSRTIYRASIAAVFRQLADWHARAQARRKRQERTARSVC